MIFAVLLAHYVTWILSHTVAQRISLRRPHLVADRQKLEGVSLNLTHLCEAGTRQS